MTEITLRSLAGLFAGALLACWILTDSTGAYALETERARRIREQLETGLPKAATDKDVAAVRDDLNKVMQDVLARIGALESDMVDLKSRLRVLELRTAVSGDPVPGSIMSDKSAPEIVVKKSPAKTGAQMQVSVCAAGCDVTSFNDAANMVMEGGTITVSPGAYSDCIAIKKSMKVIGNIGEDGSRAHLSKVACNGKAAIDINAPEVTIKGLQISDIAVPDQNGACVRVSQKALMVVLSNIICRGSENGILGGTAPNGKFIIENSTFESNGKGGRAHGIYINGPGDVVLRNVRILSTDNGHLLKTGARSILIENSILAALGGNSGRGVDIFAGGKFTMRNSVLQLGPNTQNHDMFAYALETKRIAPGAEHAILIENNWIIYDDKKRPGRWLWHKKSNVLGAFDMRNNKLVGGIDPILKNVDMDLNKQFKDRDAAGLPDYDGTLASMPKPGS